MTGTQNPDRAARIAIVDDHPLLREGLAVHLGRHPDLEICGEAEGVEDGYRLVRRLQPDLALVDLSLKDGDGLELVRRIAKEFPTVRVLVLSSRPERSYGERAVRAGARGYLDKQEAREKVVDAVRRVLAGSYWLSTELQDRLTGLVAQGGVHGKEATGSPADVLSNRELDVFRLIGGGLATAEIAERLGIGIKTVETHRQRIKEKLRLDTGPRLVHAATLWVQENS